MCRGEWNCLNCSAPYRSFAFFLSPVVASFLLSSSGDEDGVRRIKASRLRFNMQPLATQRDFVNSYYYVKVATDLVSTSLRSHHIHQSSSGTISGLLCTHTAREWCLHFSVGIALVRSMLNAPKVKERGGGKSLMQMRLAVSRVLYHVCMRNHIDGDRRVAVLSTSEYSAI